MTDGQHLHLDDYPETRRAVERPRLGARSDNERLGYRAHEHGAFVDWEHMIAGPLSSTEVAIAPIARGCAMLERAGGLPPRLAGVVAELVGAVV